LDLDGRQLFAFTGEGPRDYAMPPLSPGRLYVLRAQGSGGNISRLLQKP
jgi:hypothetical protein